MTRGILQMNCSQQKIPEGSERCCAGRCLRGGLLPVGKKYMKE